MHEYSLFSTLFLGMSLGILHALDADHVAAVSSLASTRTGKRHALFFCGKWAMGHGLSLLLIGGSVLILGFAIPETLSRIAENLVGVVLIAIGIWVLWEVYRRPLHLHFHQHADHLPHAHWHTHADNERHEDNNNSAHQHTHSAVFVGGLHGVAGSAPLLALLPMTRAESTWLAMSYIAFFSIGVLIAMLLFGGMISIVFQWLQKHSISLLNWLRGLTGVVSLGLGSYLLYHSI